MSSAADDSSTRRRALADALSAAALDSAQTTDPALRRKVAEGKDVPDELTAYVDKIHNHAYKIVDADLAALKRAGHDDDYLFELTVSAAVGAGMARLRAGLEALEASEISGAQRHVEADSSSPETSRANKVVETGSTPEAE